MIVSVREARKILGKEAKQYTDEQIEEIVNLFTAISDLAIDSYLEKKKQGKFDRQKPDKEEQWNKNETKNKKRTAHL